MSKHIKFLNYSFVVLMSLFFADEKSRKSFEDVLHRVLELGRKINLEQHIIKLAEFNILGILGYAKNFDTALQLLSTVTPTSETVQLQAACYFQDPSRDSYTGIKILSDAADKFPLLYYLIADFYSDGYIGIEPNLELAKQYYLMAINANHYEAHVGLAILLVDTNKPLFESPSQGRDELKEQILSHLQIAHDHGSADAAFFMGKFFLEGSIFEKDIDKATMCFHEAVRRSNHASAIAYLKTIEAGYRGGPYMPIKVALIKQQSLKESGYLDKTPNAMTEYGFLMLFVNPSEGILYLNKSAGFFNKEAIYILTCLQIFTDHPDCEFSLDIVSELNKYNFRHLIVNETPKDLIPVLKTIFDFAKLIKHYLDLDYQIPFDFIINSLGNLSSDAPQTLSQIQDHIKEHFPSESIYKTRLLAQSIFRREKSPDTECRIATQQVLDGVAKNHGSLHKKLNRLHNDPSLSMHQLSNCLTRFLQSGVKLTGEAKKTIKAAVNTHPPHGRGDRNDTQPLEGGRQKTANAAIEVMKTVEGSKLGI